MTEIQIFPKKLKLIINLSSLFLELKFGKFSQTNANFEICNFGHSSGLHFKYALKFDQDWMQFYININY